MSSRRIELASVPNLRDLGTLPVAGGTFRTGVVYRSTDLAGLSDADLPRYLDLGVQTVFDLRTAGERTQAPDRLTSGEREINLDVLADSVTDAAASLTGLLDDPTQTEKMLGGGRSVTLMVESYRNLVQLASALSSYRSFFHDLADPKREGAALFHCTTGKDRTGWAAASLLTLLGADTHTIYADYLETNHDLAPATEPVLKQAEQKGISRSALEPVLGVRREYLDTAFQQVDDTYGSMDAYFHDGLGLTDDVEGALRERFVVSG